jgi:membrane protein required for beta-lactamase induction
LAVDHIYAKTMPAQDKTTAFPPDAWCNDHQELHHRHSRSKTTPRSLACLSTVRRLETLLRMATSAHIQVVTGAWILSLGQSHKAQFPLLRTIGSLELLRTSVAMSREPDQALSEVLRNVAITPRATEMPHGFQIPSLLRLRLISS